MLLRHTCGHGFNKGTASVMRVAVFVDGHVKAMKHEAFWKVLPRYTHRYNAGGDDVFAHFWPYE